MKINNFYKLQLVYYPFANAGDDETHVVIIDEKLHIHPEFFITVKNHLKEYCKKASQVSYDIYNKELFEDND